MRLMVNCAIELQTKSYEETCSAVWGRPGYYAIACICYLIDFGVLVTYWVALGDLATPPVEDILGKDFVSEVVVKLVLAGVLLPACFIRNLGKIPGWAYVNYAIIIFAIVSMLCLVFQQDTADFNRDHIEPLGVPLQPNWAPVKDGLWPSLGTVAFTFVNHDSVFTIYQSLKRGTRGRWAAVTIGAMWSTVLLMMALGLPTYLALGDKTRSNLIRNFPNSPLMFTVRCALALSLSMTMLYLQQVGRKYLHSLVMPVVRRRALTASESYNMSRGEVAFFTSVQFMTTLSCGVLLKDLGLPMALTGVFAQSLAAFVVPPCLLLTLAWRGNRVGHSRLTIFLYVPVLIFGLVSCTLGVQSTLQEYGVSMYI